MCSTLPLSASCCSCCPIASLPAIINYSENISIDSLYVCTYIKALLQIEMTKQIQYALCNCTLHNFNNSKQNVPCASQKM